MGYVTVTSTIHAPVEAVWNALNDIDHTPQWVEGLRDAKVITPGAYGPGTIYHDHNQMGPFPQVTPWHITAFEPVTHQVHESESAVLPSRMTLNLSPAPDGTSLQMIVDYRFLPQLGPLSRLLENSVMNRLLRQVITRNQANLNVYLSRQPQPALA